MNHRFGLIWLRAFREGPDAVRELYAEDFSVQDMVLDAGHTCRRQDDLDGRPHLAALRERQDQALLGLRGQRHGIIQWRWSGEHLKTFRGVPTENHRLSTVGQTFQQYDAQGKITRETTYWADLKALKALGTV